MFFFVVPNLLKVEVKNRCVSCSNGEHEKPGDSIRDRFWNVTRNQWLLVTGNLQLGDKRVTA